MLKVHLDDGHTLRFDLSSDADAQRWAELAKSAAFQSRITALSLSQNGVQYSLPKPEGFESVFFNAEFVPANGSKKIKGGEKVLCHAGDVGLVLMAHRETRAARVDVSRVGKLRYNPATSKR